MIGLMLLDEISAMFFCFAAAVCFPAYMKIIKDFQRQEDK